jgi:small nuclear ribonucleoprotein (snRNP)-like protein
VIAAVCVFLAVAAVGAAVVWWLEERGGLPRGTVRRRAIVTLKTGEAFSGVVFDVDRQAFVLRNAEVVGLGDKRTSVPVDGEVLILRADVAYLQLP